MVIEEEGAFFNDFSFLLIYMYNRILGISSQVAVIAVKGIIDIYEFIQRIFSGCSLGVRCSFLVWEYTQKGRGACIDLVCCYKECI